MGTRPPRWQRLQSKTNDSFFVNYQLVRHPSSPVNLRTRHASDHSRCFDDVSGLHVLRRDDPSFPAASSYKRDVSRPACTIKKPGCVFRSFGVLVEVLHGLKLVSPARVVSHLNDLLIKGLALTASFVTQSLKVYHPVSLFMASADAMCPNLSCDAGMRTL